MPTLSAPPASPARSASRVDQNDRTGAWTQLRLWIRLTRRGTAWLVGALSVYVAVEVVAFDRAYPTAADRARLEALADNPAVRMLQGVPRDISSTGGYVVWDAGWFLLAVLGAWACLATSRLTRGEEDGDRVCLVLAAPTSACATLAAQLAVLGAACLATGAGIAVALVATGAGAGGGLLFGAAVAGFGATVVAGTAVLAQVLPHRRRVLAVAGGALALAYLARMVANSGDDRAALTWLTPFGWVDQVRAYADDRAWALTPLVLVPALLAGTALRLRLRRDLGGALLPERAYLRRSTHGLSGATAFAWRSGRGVLAGWFVGVAGYALVIASVAPAVTRLTEQDPDYRAMLEAIGMQAASIASGGLPLVVLVVGLSVLCFAVAPRKVPVVPVAATATAYLLALLGPALDAPGWLVAASPFAHLAYVPVEPFPIATSLWLCATGVGAGVLGAGILGRRDVRPA